MGLLHVQGFSEGGGKQKRQHTTHAARLFVKHGVFCLLQYRVVTTGKKTQLQMFVVSLLILTLLDPDFQTATLHRLQLLQAKISSLKQDLQKEANLAQHFASNKKTDHSLAMALNYSASVQMKRDAQYISKFEKQAHQILTNWKNWRARKKKNVRHKGMEFELKLSGSIIYVYIESTSPFSGFQFEMALRPNHKYVRPNHKYTGSFSSPAQVNLYTYCVAIFCEMYVA